MATKRADGYKAIMIKEAVGAEFRAKAKAEGKTFTAFLEGLLHRYNKEGAMYETYNKEIKGIVERVEEEVKQIRGTLEEVRR